MTDKDSNIKVINPEENDAIDIDKLLHALDNENNTGIGDLTTAIIKKQKNDVLQQLQLPREKLKELHTKLKEYRYVNDLDDIQYGHYIRWIPLKNPEIIKLTRGAIVCDLRVFNEKIHVRCRNASYIVQHSLWIFVNSHWCLQQKVRYWNKWKCCRISLRSS